MAKDPVQVSAANVTSDAGVPRPPPAGGRAFRAPARGFQKSYDEEALGHFDVALSALDDTPTTPNASYVAELRRGWLLYRIGKNAESVAAYRKAISQTPASIEARGGALAPLAAQRRWMDVETTARDVAPEGDPGNYQASIRLAFALYSLAKFADAAAGYRGILAAYPSDVDAADGLGWSLLRSSGRRTDAAGVVRARARDRTPQRSLRSRELTPRSDVASRATRLPASLDQRPAGVDRRVGCRVGGRPVRDRPRVAPIVSTGGGVPSNT